MKNFLALFVACVACILPAFGQNDFKRRVANEGTPGMNVLRAATTVSSTETITVNGVVWEVYTGATAVTSGRISVDVSAGGVKASGTLTLTENAANTNTVTIGSTVYTFQDTLTNVAYNVKVGASASATIDNLIAAITAGAGSGTAYAAATTAHPSVTAAAGDGDTMTVTALVTGTAGNSIATTDTLAGSSAFGAAVLQNGAQPTAEQFTDAFVAATNASAASPINAVKISANETVCYTRQLNKAWASTETLAGTNNAWAAATFFGQSVGKVTDAPVTALKRTATATEVTLQTMHFFFAFEPAGAVIQVRNTDGTLKAVDGAMTISGRRVSWASSGSTDVDADDVVSVLAW
jgi:hypothetical protein